MPYGKNESLRVTMVVIWTNSPVGHQPGRRGLTMVSRRCKVHCAHSATHDLTITTTDFTTPIDRTCGSCHSNKLKTGRFESRPTALRCWFWSRYVPFRGCRLRSWSPENTCWDRGRNVISGWIIRGSARNMPGSSTMERRSRRHLWTTAAG